MGRFIARLVVLLTCAMLSVGSADAQAPAIGIPLSAFTQLHGRVATEFADDQHGGATLSATYRPMAARIWFEVDGARQDCSGVLISPRKVLTAAHCICGEDRRGAWFAADAPACAILSPRLRGEVFLPAVGLAKVVGIEVHPAYRHPSITHDLGRESLADLALLTLDHAVSVTPARVGAPVAEKRYVMASFGELSFNAPFTGLQPGHIYHVGVAQIIRLREAQMGSGDCPGAARDVFCTEHFPLASNNLARKHGGACAGDSGAGVFDTGRGREAVVGIVSYIWPRKADCADNAASFNFAVNLAPYAEWIAARVAAPSPPRVAERQCADSSFGQGWQRFLMDPGLTYISATVFGDYDNGLQRPRLAIEGVDTSQCDLLPTAGVAVCHLKPTDRAVVAIDPAATVQITVCWVSRQGAH